jgi:hypothetical protein
MLDVDFESFCCFVGCGIVAGDAPDVIDKSL